MVTTTYGTGQLIRHALDHGYRSFILALGGSATNDGGCGMLQALGLQLLDAEGREVGVGGQALPHIKRINTSKWDERIDQSRFTIASDVTNPFIGPSGASHVFGPQKGATPEMVEALDGALAHWADIMEAHTGDSGTSASLVRRGGRTWRCVSSVLPLEHETWYRCGDRND